jgi:hypothetical protein
VKFLGFIFLKFEHNNSLTSTRLPLGFAPPRTDHPPRRPQRAPHQRSVTQAYILALLVWAKHRQRHSIPKLLGIPASQPNGATVNALFQHRTDHPLCRPQTETSFTHSPFLSIYSRRTEARRQRWHELGVGDETDLCSSIYLACFFILGDLL